MNVTVEYTGGARFIVSSGQHSLVSDQPVSNGGSDEGMTPPELLLASLGTCAGYYAAQYLKARNLTAGLRVAVSAEKAQNPARLGSFRLDVAVDGELDERHVQGLSRAVHSCLVHNTLTHRPEIVVAVATRCGLAVHWSMRMLEQVAQRFRALGEPQRLRILQVLEKGERPVNEIVAALDANQPNISRHLQALFEAGIVGRRREGNNVYYSIADPVVHQLCDLVCESARKQAEAEWKAARARVAQR